jgi:hypothetical protein
MIEIDECAPSALLAGGPVVMPDLLPRTSGVA